MKNSNNENLKANLAKDSYTTSKRGSEKLAKIAGARIKGYRLREGLTQTDFAKIIGVSKNSVSCYERGMVAPSLDVIFYVCEKTGISLSRFFDLEENERQTSVEQEALMRIFDATPPEARKYTIEAARAIAKASSSDYDINKKIEKVYD